MKGIDKFLIAGVIGALLLVAVTFLVVALIPRPTDPTVSATPLVQEDVDMPVTQVIVALQPIPQGSEFVAGSIGRRDWPVNNVPPDVIADEAETIGKVAATDIVQGQVMVRSMLTEQFNLAGDSYTQAWCDIENGTTLVYSLTTPTGPTEEFTTIRGASGAIRLEALDEANTANISCVRDGAGSVTVNFIHPDQTSGPMILYSCFLPLNCQDGAITVTGFTGRDEMTK